jgi:hypothetical protein
MKTILRGSVYFVVAALLTACSGSEKLALDQKIASIDVSVDSLGKVLQSLPDSATQQEFDSLQVNAGRVFEVALAETKIMLDGAGLSAKEKAEIKDRFKASQVKIHLFWKEWHVKKFSQMLEENRKLTEKMSQRLDDLEGFPPLTRQALESTVRMTLLTLEQSKRNIEEALQAKIDSLAKAQENL